MLPLLLAGVLGLLFIIVLSSSWKRKPHLPPGPTPWPLLGNLHQIDKSAPYETLMELGQKYGDVYTVYLGPKPVVVLFGYNVLKDALLGQADDFSGRAILPVFDRIFHRKGLVFSNGEHWQQQRKFSLTTLRTFGMGKRSIEERVTEEARFLVEFFKSKKERITAAVSNVICSIVFGDRFNTEDEIFLTLLRMVNENIAFLGKRGFQMYNTFPGLMKWLPGEHNKIFENGRNLKVFLDGLIENHIASRDPNCPRDFIDSFLNKMDGEAKNLNSHFTLESLVCTTFNLFIAGTETTASTIRWAVTFALEYPDMQEKMQKEIDEVLGSQRCPSMEDRLQMPYTEAFLSEVQRFGSIIPNGLPHEALHDIKFKGYIIPKGTQVITFLHSSLTDKRYWDDPKLFNPDRFLDENGKFKKNDAFIPFGAGKRSCIGESLARKEIFIFFVTMLQNFSLNVPEGESGKIELAGGGTRAPKPFTVCALDRVQ
ncbi:cytochrome P450 2B15-like isoform X2 [Ambystoma mexicanum]|uniref:cytochrome P450 2B15-like isoform X2 n=1 Tax=Ambystoma mexicanum TaxID=8296 RepID=UPI0037E93CCE